MESVNYNEMAKRKNISEKEIAGEYEILQSTSDFLTKMLRTKSSELEFVLKTMESNYTDELAQRANRVQEEIQGLQRKINWEVKQCSEFDKKVQKWNAQQQLQFINQLSKKILNKE